MLRIILPLIFLATLLAAQAHSEIYKWRDENGVLHFTDTPPVDISTEEGLETMSGSAGTDSSFNQVVGKPSTTGTSDRKAAIRNAKVEVYLTSWCPWCEKTLDFFRSQGVRVRAYDIEKDASAARRKEKLAPGQGVPTTVVNGRVINGYAPGAFEAALKGSR